jgi:hypothetical protein
MKSFILGIAGYARCGKNSMARAISKVLVEKGILVKEYAFASELKKELNPLTTLNLGISTFTEDNKEKKIIRPLLICWGTQVWRELDEDHWVKKVDQVIKNDPLPHVAIITDVRFPNESSWVKENNGFVLHLSRTVNNQLIEAGSLDETKYDPLVKAMSDYCYEWGTFGDSFEEKCYYKAKDLIEEIFAENLTEWQKEYQITT